MKNVKNKTSKKMSLRSEKKVIKSARKSSSNSKSEDKEFNDVDSLVLLNDAKERKKLHGIDERIKLLKTELKSLLGNTKIDNNHDCFADKSDLDGNTVDDAKGPGGSKADIRTRENLRNVSTVQANDSNECNTSFNSTSATFSEWLDKTENEMDIKCENGIFDTSKPVSNLKQQIDKSTERIPDFGSKFSSNIFSLSQQDVEQLLYKSFLMQDSAAFLHNSEASASDVKQCSRKMRQQNCRKSRRQKKCTRGKSAQGCFSPFERIARRGVKRKIPNSSVCDSDIEVINLDSSNNITNPNITCVDLDVSNYDWSEPFDINKESESHHSDVQVVEDSGEINDQNKELNSPESNRINRSTYDDSREFPPKKVWECPICFERAKGQEVVATQCGHVFCRKCLEDHMSKLSRNCPTCRSDLKDKPFITLFNF